MDWCTATLFGSGFYNVHVSIRPKYNARLSLPSRELAILRHGLCPPDLHAQLVKLSKRCIYKQWHPSDEIFKKEYKKRDVEALVYWGARAEIGYIEFDRQARKYTWNHETMKQPWRPRYLPKVEPLTHIFMAKKAGIEIKEPKKPGLKIARV